MDYVPISEKKNMVDSAQLKEGESQHPFKAPDPPPSSSNLHSPMLSPAGGPLVYDSVQLVQNSEALNGTQRVLLDHVISEQECSDLRHLAHVRVSHLQQSCVLLPSAFLCADPFPGRKLMYLLPRQAVTMAGDGYRGRMSPHTPNEKFEGATVLKTLRVLTTPDLERVSSSPQEGPLQPCSLCLTVAAVRLRGQSAHEERPPLLRHQ